MGEPLDIQPLQKYYRGFTIDEPLGNNAFSFARRQNKQIYVPALRCGNIADVRPGDRTVFSEVADDTEYNVCGLEAFIYTRRQGKDIFVFDNHNHAFCFWYYGLRERCFSPELALLHVDQHRDSRKPGLSLPGTWTGWDLDAVFEYTQTHLNVGNFIPPALDADFFQRVINVDSEDALALEMKQAYVLDLDLDLFAPEMAYIPYEKKFRCVRRLVEGADFITIALSPYFMDIEEACSVLEEIFSGADEQDPGI
ncbi:MAG: UPF0489 family protein [Candidatus Omnitrophota bacterium]